MTKLLRCALTLAFGFSLSCCAQTPGTPTVGPGNTAGLLYASNFGLWQVPQGNTGQYSWSSPSFCTVSAAGIPLAPVFAVGTPVFIKDQVVANSEIVTPSAINVGGAGCSITVSPVNKHNTFTLTSATGGLQEAINYAHALPYQVILTPDWSRLGGTTGMILAAKGNSNVQILDQRGSCSTAYIWSGSAYAAQPSSCGGGSSGIISVNSQTGPSVTFQSSGATVAITNPSPNVINLESSGGGGGGVPFFTSPTTNIVFVGLDSQIGDDQGHLLVPASTIPLATTVCDGAKCTAIPATGHTFSFSTGDWIYTGGIYSPSFLGNNAIPAPYGDNMTGPTCCVFRVLPGATSTSISWAYTAGTGSGTGGVVFNAEWRLPFYASLYEPFIHDHGVLSVVQDNSYNTAGMLANYHTLMDKFNPATTGQPCLAVITGPGNDLVANVPLATLESQLQDLWTGIHGIGCSIIQITSFKHRSQTNPPVGEFLAGQLNDWIRNTAILNSTLQGTASYPDYISDSGAKLLDGSVANSFEGTGELLPGGVKIIADDLNEVFANQKSTVYFQNSSYLPSGYWGSSTDGIHIQKGVNTREYWLDSSGNLIFGISGYGPNPVTDSIYLYQQSPSSGRRCLDVGTDSMVTGMVAGECITTLTTTGTNCAAPTVSGSTLNIPPCSPSGGSGISSINSQTGPAITVQSSGATVAITNPSANVINLEASSSGGGGCMTPMSQTVGSATATVTFSGIPQTCKDLTIRISGQSANTGERLVQMFLNGDTSPNYYYIQCAVPSTATVPACNSVTSTTAYVFYLSGTNSSSFNVAAGTAEINGYTNASWWKVVNSKGFYTSIGGTNTAYSFSTEWQATPAAITSMILTVESGQWQVGDVITITGS